MKLNLIIKGLLTIKFLNHSLDRTNVKDIRHKSTAVLNFDVKFATLMISKINTL
jgi:hypothetical protein